MNADHPPDHEAASPEDVCDAIDSLTPEDRYRIRKAAESFIFGTEYQDPNDLINEAVVRTMNAASGGVGRRWPKNVLFVAYLIQTMKGLADDSQNSLFMRKTVAAEGMASENEDAEDLLGRLGHGHQDALTQAIDCEDEAEARESAIADAVRIEEFFADDEQVSWIIMGHKDDCSAEQIREMSGMTETQYNTARRRFRRGLAKLFPGRGKS